MNRADLKVAASVEEQLARLEQLRGNYELGDVALQLDRRYVDDQQIMNAVRNAALSVVDLRIQSLRERLQALGIDC